MAMKVHFLGGANEVGASCIMVEMADQRILVDAGIRVSPKARDGLSGELLPDLSILNEAPPDAVIITHAHADHIGAVPLVLGAFPGIPVYTTPATISLMSVMFRDALKIMDKRFGSEGELPTYDMLQVENVEAACRPTDLRQEFSIAGKVNVTFYRAGHIPGAASIYLQSDEGTVLISGDMSFSPMRATPRAEIPPVRPDVLILESTYGGKLHANRAAEERRIIDDISRVLERGGRVLVPAFALGRAQEVALVLDNAIAKRQLPPVPVYMDGMTRSITRVFERFPDYLSKTLNDHLEENPNVFQTPQVQFVGSQQQRQSIMHSTEPMVVISSSGMLTGGASPLYAQRMVNDERNAIFITGYQDDEAPGKALQRLSEEKGGTLMLNGKRHTVKCEINTYALSAHADENELTQYASQLEPRHTFLVHGDGMARTRMRDLISKRQLSVSLAQIGDAVDISGTASIGRRRDVPTVPTFSVAPITNLDEIDVGLPLYDATGELYIRHARKAIRRLLPIESGLRKISFDKINKKIKLSFDYPEVARQRYGDVLQMIEQMVDWKMRINKGANTVALNTKAKELAPGMVGRLSIYTAERVCEVQLAERPNDWKEVQDQFYEITGFRLVQKGARDTMPATDTTDKVGPTVIEPTGGRPQSEINEAYNYLRMRLGNEGLYKTGLKNGMIVLSFITPQKGLMLGEDFLQQLATEVGYQLMINPNPNQFALIELANQLSEMHDLHLVRNPSVLMMEHRLVIEPGVDVAADSIAVVQTVFAEQTGWELGIKGQ